MKTLKKKKLGTIASNSLRYLMELESQRKTVPSDYVGMLNKVLDRLRLKQSQLLNNKKVIFSPNNKGKALNF